METTQMIKEKESKSNEGFEKDRKQISDNKIELQNRTSLMDCVGLCSFVCSYSS